MRPNALDVTPSPHIQERQIASFSTLDGYRCCRDRCSAYPYPLHPKGNFSANCGTRATSMRSRIPRTLQGERYRIPFGRYQDNERGIDVTIGNFYDQFGSGLVFRSYEERNLGIDNAMDGFRDPQAD